MTLNGYAWVIDTDGCRYRRYVRWGEVPSIARLPEHRWPLRWDLQDYCAVAIPDTARGRDPRFRPCGMKRSPGADSCAIHVRQERHPRHWHGPGDSE
jgi:hypothetical protein